MPLTKLFKKVVNLLYGGSESTGFAPGVCLVDQSGAALGGLSNSIAPTPLSPLVNTNAAIPVPTGYNCLVVRYTNNGAVKVDGTIAGYTFKLPSASLRFVRLGKQDSGLEQNADGVWIYNLVGASSVAIEGLIPATMEAQYQFVNTDFNHVVSYIKAQWDVAPITWTDEIPPALSGDTLADVERVKITHLPTSLGAATVNGLSLPVGASREYERPNGVIPWTQTVASSIEINYGVKLYNIIQLP